MSQKYDLIESIREKYKSKPNQLVIVDDSVPVHYYSNYTLFGFKFRSKKTPLYYPLSHSYETSSWCNCHARIYDGPSVVGFWDRLKERILPVIEKLEKSIKNKLSVKYKYVRWNGKLWDELVEERNKLSSKQNDLWVKFYYENIHGQFLNFDTECVVALEYVRKLQKLT